jgi:hypothetical protein
MHPFKSWIKQQSKHIVSFLLSESGDKWKKMLQNF